MTYNILKYPWHTPHDYELAKLDHRFFYLTNTPRMWAVEQRPVPDNIVWVPHADAVKTEAMILHLDQWSYQEPSKRFQFLRFKRSYLGPKIVLNHGCNMVDGCSSDVMRKLVEGCTMVCNSRTAQQLWGYRQSRFIRHGMSPEEWPSTTYARNNVVVTQAYGKVHGAYRNYEGLRKIEAEVPICWIGRDLSFRSFIQYRRYLQTSSIFVNPSWASPNPRARTEAMLTGLAIVTTKCHGEEEWIENGVNGYATNDIDEMIAYLKQLQADPAEARRMGRAGRATAQEIFHIDEFRRQWNELLGDVIG